ncbi:MAG TPA: 50S ribosomal protein L3 [Candidatus Limnocylindria bacterium]|nr:50S ribosomal protein L3 [Candidatus Limnocylindria bacterium]
MVLGLWGKKIGMTQVFSEQGVVPVTVIDVANWFVTRIKTQERDGYNAVQIGRVKDRYAQETFSAEWLKKPSTYFSFIKEVTLAQPAEGVTAGNPADFYSILAAGDKVDVSGKSKGAGFAGVVRRHGFAGSPASHGSTMGKRSGSLSFMRSRGRVIKGKRLPGHLGNESHMVKNLEVIRIEPDAKIVLVKGAIPGKSGSLVYVRKA